MASAQRVADALVNWYQASARPFFDQWSKERIESLDAEFLRLDQIRKASRRDLSVCFLGQSGVGKSTLVNALVGEGTAILPAGGIGPLTAQATSVRWAQEKFFRVEYLPAKKVNELLFALESAHEAKERKLGRAVKGTSDDVASTLDEEGRAEAQAAVPVGDDAPAEQGQSKIDGMERQARLMILGDQFKAEGDLAYLADRLREIMSLKLRWGTSARSEDGDRIRSLRAIIEQVKARKARVERRESEGGAEFRVALHEHASGHLAPLIKTLDVSWPAKFLGDGLVLVDLPGLGVANDDYRRVTHEHIRNAKAIVLVVDRAGVGEESAQLLHSTGFLNSLLHESHDPDAEPVSLLVGVVKVDLTADENRRTEREQLGEAGREKSRRWLSHFEEACEKSVAMVRQQLRAQLERIVAQGPDATLEDRRAVIERVLERTEVHPVSALEYRKLLLGDEEEPARISESSQSRIPGLIDALRNVSSTREKLIEMRLSRLAFDLGSRVRAAIEVIREQWSETSRAQEEVERLGSELDKVIAPLQREFAQRRGSFREFLRESLPQQIEARVGEATGSARTDIGRYLRKYEDYHWATLRAAVRRGGSYDGARHVDLPNELALRFEEPVAVVWSKSILASLRKRTADLGSDYVEMVGEIVAWARSQGARVQSKLVEALHEELKLGTKDLANVGKEAIDDLKQRVRAQLASRVEERIRKRCQKFVDERKHEGPGVKARILELFREDLTDAVVAIAKPTATDVLVSNYRVVEKEISGIFAKYPNPLDTAKDQILGSHEERVRRSDEKQRKAVLADAEAVLAAAPNA
jgi:predicted GTPase